MLCVRGARALRYNIWVYIGDPSLATIAAGQQSFCYWSLPVGGFAPGDAGRYIRITRAPVGARARARTAAWAAAPYRQSRASRIQSSRGFLQSEMPIDGRSMRRAPARSSSRNSPRDGESAMLAKDGTNSSHGLMRFAAHTR